MSAPPEIAETARMLARVDAWDDVPEIGDCVAWRLRGRGPGNWRGLPPSHSELHEAVAMRRAHRARWLSVYQERADYHRAALTDLWERGLLRLEEVG